MISSQGKRALLTDGPLLKQLLSLTWPNIGGLLGIMIFNLTDTYFVSRMGTEPLAAMGFTFPVVMIIGSAASGISLGAGSVLSRAMGEGNHHLMKRTATDGILLSVILVAFISIAGLLTLDPLFRLMGASGESLTLVKEYMFIWYLGAITITMPPISDSCLRATGDMIRPFIVMMIIAIINVILDPIFIFGYFGVPAMGIKGAAYATILSRFFGMIATLGFLHFHAGLVDFSHPLLKEIWESWGRILHVGIPAAMTLLLPPLTRGVLTSLAASAGGAVAVAALAAGSRIEGFIQIFMMSYSMALVPMIGQNWGAGKMDRILKIRNISLRLSLVYGAASFAVLMLLAPVLAGIFSSDLEVISHIAFYLRVTAVAAAALSYMTWINQSLNASGHPRASARLNIFAYILVIIPLAFIGSRIAGFKGIVIALSAGQFIGAFWAHGEGCRIFNESKQITGSSNA
ncbi:MATE family efflux transporter [Oceanispirochaeta sp. M1]|uniref:MATE family efflux transporter n=1 Tax=Oceanispirochaeta sp. M1 TaxID=2283433 RepID=UPI000E09367A|nr:MATE family efflux transporter [Oceanispirochaeta sp. M1]NPD74837.1 MATE family efflux transporter [Oceanispirochaeta sp. M1]RDG29330.1 MATE family efflux transporter [Oceanispirochaeta sp. M1]